MCWSVGRVVRSPFSPVVAAFTVLILLGPLPAVQAQKKYTPDHPDVQELVNDGLSYIMSNRRSSRVGSRVLLGMAAYKARLVNSVNPKEHPLIEAAVETILEECTETKLAGAAAFEKMYASALA